MRLFLTRIVAIARSKEFISFFVGSAAGLAIDLVGFQILNLAGLQPWLANGISSFASITVVYVLVTRYAFRSTATVWSYVAFVVWYSSSIVLFSFLIQTLSTASGWPPLAWKLLSVPVSFGLNYLFGRALFARVGRRNSPRTTGQADDSSEEA